MENNQTIRPEGFDVQRVIQYLTGTCKSLDEALQELYGVDDEVLTEADHEEIDGEIFRCSTCDWWFAVEEMADEGECEDCREGEVDKLNDEEDYPGEDSEDD